MEDSSSEDKRLLKEKRHQYHLKNIDHIDKQKHEYYEQNKEWIKAKTKAYAEQNKEKISIYQKEYNVKNKDGIRIKQKLYNAKNHDRIAETKRIYGKKNRQHLNLMLKANYHRVRLVAIDHYSNGLNQCSCCGESELKFLTFNHMNGGGHIHRLSMNINLVAWLYKHKFPQGFEVLCFNCNCGKSVNKGVCPHQELKWKNCIPMKKASNMSA